MKTLIFVFATFMAFHQISAATWQVGPSRIYTAPSQVSSLVADGDVVEIDAGIYESDVALWSVNNLILKGMNGKAHLKANGAAYGEKGIWVISGSNITVENIEFSLCTVPDQNGAGIRFQGTNLNVKHCYFHHNQNGILSSSSANSSILIEYSEFAFNGNGDGFSHNVYIGKCDMLTFRYNYSHDVNAGHELKSRADVNLIMYNRITDEPSSTANYNIDIPNGGTTYIIGNLIGQGAMSENNTIIAYGLESLDSSAPHKLYAINNTIFNSKPTGKFFSFGTGTAVFKAYNNIMTGQGTFINGTSPASIDTATNRIAISPSAFNFDGTNYHLTALSTNVINAGTDAGTTTLTGLNPTMEYVHPTSSSSRCTEGTLDIGAFEYCGAIGMEEINSNLFLIFPNPVNDILHLEIPTELKFTAMVFSEIGQMVLSDNSRTVDVSALPKGIYFIRLIFDDQVKSAKFIKR